MVVLLTFFWYGKCGSSAVGVSVILGNKHGIQGQNYVSSLQRSKATVGFHYSNWVICKMLYVIHVEQ